MTAEALPPAEEVERAPRGGVTPGPLKIAHASTTCEG